MAISTPTFECDRCGADMAEVETWSSKSPPLIGRRIHYAEHKCPECGNDVLFKRTSEDEDWERA